MHLEEGEIQAYQDQEVSADQRAYIHAHLESCARCQRRAAALQAQAQRTTSRLETLEPDSLQTPISPILARSRLTARLEDTDKEQNRMWHYLKNRVPRQAWVALAVVTILAISLAFAPVRAIASSFLGLFRVEQIQVIEIDPEALSQQLESSAEAAHLMGENVQVEAQGEPQQVDSAAEASALAGFSVRLPAKLEEDTRLTVQPGGKATFNVDLELVDAVLHDMGRSDIQLPPELDGASVEITIPTLVGLEIGDCGDELSDNPEHAATPVPRRYKDCTTLLQTPSPTISAPPELDIAQIGQAYLQLLGMDEQEAALFASNVDWTTTFIMPIPRYGTDYQEVQVDGVTGTFVYQEGYSEQYFLLWIKDSIVYALNGAGDLASALEIANSLE
jgi:anti-sigma factor RsiW